jgi:choline-sulfatase
MPSRRPNILFLLSDEHSFRFLGHRSEADGGEPVETPNLDRLAARGTVFSAAHCQMPLCTPSRLCLLTGREAFEAGAWDNGSILHPDHPTLPSTLRDSGYTTCLIGKMHLGGDRQFVGFEHRPYGDLTGGTGHQADPIHLKSHNGMRDRTATAGVTEIPESLLQEQVVAQETLAFAREQSAADPEKPWFICASFSRPHFPLTAPRRWIDHYRRQGITEPKVGKTGDAYDHPMSVGMRAGFETDAIDEAETIQARLAYFACVSYLDEILGDLLVRLEQAGLLENTIIVYTSDHGEYAGEHGTWWKHGWQDASVRVPLILSTPEQRNGSHPVQSWDTPVSLIDLFPTLCRLAGATSPHGLQGHDLSPSIGGNTPPPDEPVFSDNLGPRWGPGTEFRMVRQGDLKYVRFRHAPPLCFNLKNDPDEQTNLLHRSPADTEAEAIEKLRAIADRSIDFDRAEKRRNEWTAQLAAAHPLQRNTPAGNHYHMPDGTVVYAESPLYNPEVETDDPATHYSDFPKRNENG